MVPQNTNYESIQQTARSIAEQAHVLAYDPNYMSPFAQFACDNGLNVRGKCPSITKKMSIFCNLNGYKRVFSSNKPNWLLFPVHAGGKPDDITVLLSIVAEYTD